MIDFNLLELGQFRAKMFVETDIMKGIFDNVLMLLFFSIIIN